MLDSIRAKEEVDWWAELRSATEACARDATRVDLVVLLLTLWPEREREVARTYARDKLARLALDENLDAWEVVSWCISGAPALRERLGRFHTIRDRGVERWLSVFAWALACGQRHGASLMDMQATASFEVEGSAGMRQLILMLDHRGATYLLDTQQGPQHLCLGIVSGATGGLNIKWPGFPAPLDALAWELSGSRIRGSTSG